MKRVLTLAAMAAAALIGTAVAVGLDALRLDEDRPQ